MKSSPALFFFMVCASYCFLPVQSGAQEPYFRHFGVEQGLPSSEVYDILQDRNGFIWIATDRGVSRYDGYSFRNFNTSDGLTDNTVFHLLEDAAGNIWCATLNSRLCYFSGETIVPYKYNDVIAAHATRSYILQSIDVTSSGDVLLGYQQSGCARIDKHGNYSDVIASGPSNRMEISITDSSLVYGSIAANKEAELNTNFMVERNGSALGINLDTNLASYYFTVLSRDNGTLLVGISNLLVEIEPSGIVRQHMFEVQLNELNRDAAGNVWVSLRGRGVRRYSPGADFSGSAYTAFLPRETVTDVYQDREGGYWMSTHEHGLFYLVSPHVHFLLPSNSTAVTAIASMPDGRVLLGTAGGLLHTCTAGKISASLDLNVRPESPAFFQDIYVSPGGDGIWIATNQSEVFVPAEGKAERIKGGLARAVSGDGGTGAWFGGSNKLYHFSKGRMERDSMIVHNNRINALYWDTVTGSLLVGLHNGFFWMDGQELRPFPLPGAPVTSRISAIRRLQGGALLIATIGAGITILRDERQTTIGAAQGLCSSIINDIDVDTKGDIWAATNAGLARIHPQADTFVIRCFSIFHGLPTNEVRQVHCRNDTVWIGMTNGAAWFVPRELEHAAIPPPVFIQEILVNGEKIDFASAGSFSHQQKQVRFSFIGISYRNGGNTTYRYRLAGLDSGWIYTSNRSVEYSSLPPGTYRFEVMARNGDGTWSAAAASFAFEIHPPYWLTWWFWTITVALLAGAGWWIIRRRLGNIRRNARQKGLLAEYQHQALAAQMNPHFIFNSLSSMQAFVLGDEKENALRYIDRFSFLMRKSLEHSMLKFVSLEKEIELLRAYLDIETMRFGDKITYTITCDPSLPLSMEVPAMLVQPFAENAIRHGLLHREIAGGRIDISFTMKENSVWCRVEDNGVGSVRSAEINRTRRKHVSFGSSITEERLRLLCDVTGQPCSITYTDKSAKDGHSAGTIVEFILPSRKREPHAESLAH